MHFLNLRVGCVKQGLLVTGGIVLASFAYSMNEPKKLIRVVNHLMTEKNFKEFEHNYRSVEDWEKFANYKAQIYIDRYRAPAIAIGCSVAVLAFVAYVVNVLKDDNKKHNKSENLKHVNVTKILETYPKVGG